MKCSKCGIEFPEGIFCPECGTRVTEPQVADNNQLRLNGEATSVEIEDLAKRKEAFELRKQELELDAAHKREQMAIDMERRKQEIALELEKKRGEAILAAEQKEQDRKASERAKAENFERKALAKKEKADRDREKREKRIENAPTRFSTISLVCGIVSIITGGILIIPEIIGIVCGLKTKENGKMIGRGKAGLICSVIGLLILLVIIIVSIFCP